MGQEPGQRVDEAHAMVNRDPAEAYRIADEIATDPVVTDEVRCRALWARGMARRELHDLSGAEADLATAYRCATDLGQPATAARIASTLALVIMYLGRTSDALSLLDEAEQGSGGDDLGHLFMQRALIHHRLGDLDRALDGYHAALAHISEERDPVVIARVHANLGVLHAYRLEVDLAGHHTVLAIELADRLGQEMMAAGAEHNLGYAFARAGDLARALELMEAAEIRFARIPDSKQHLAIAQSDRADVLLKANLLAEARSLSDLALVSISEGGNVTDAADACLLAARARLAAGDLEGARTAARQTSASFEQQGRAQWLPLAEFVEVQADDADHLVDGLAERAEAVARALARARWSSEAMSARVLAGRLYLERGEFDRARRVLAGASTARHVGPAGDRAAAYLATALLHEATGSRKSARRSVNEGLRTLFENQAALGALELRAHAMAHGHELAEVGARLAIADRRPRELLSRIESARGMISLLPRANAPDDEVLADLLAELRRVSEEIREATGSGEPSVELQRRRVTTEDRIRRHSRQSSADGEAEELGLGEAIVELGDRALVEYGNVDGQLWAVSLVNGRAALHELGPVAALATDIDSVAFSLNRLNRAYGSAEARRSATTTMRAAGTALQQFLLPRRVLTSGRPLVVVPAGSLHGLAWRALPALAGHDVSVSPSLLGWAVAHRRRRGDRADRTMLVAGPTLPGADAEIAALAAIHVDASILTGADASAEQCLDEIGRAGLAHIACHGAFRSDNPLFSTLTVADGQLTLYDLERCRQLPSTMVLSACSAAASLELRGGGLLGMSSALIALGVSAVVAPLTPVADELTVEVMVRFHRALAGGASPSAALAAASNADRGDVDPTAAAFVVLGA